MLINFSIVAQILDVQNELYASNVLTWIIKKRECFWNYKFMY